ncbi:unnamed protein product [Closterium sp. NIES-53]
MGDRRSFSFPPPLLLVAAALLLLLLPPCPAAATRINDDQGRSLLLPLPAPLLASHSIPLSPLPAPSLLCSRTAMQCSATWSLVQQPTQPPLSPLPGPPSPRAPGSTGAGGVWHSMGVVGERVAGGGRV